MNGRMSRAVRRHHVQVQEARQQAQHLQRAVLAIAEARRRLIDWVRREGREGTVAMLPGQSRATYLREGWCERNANALAEALERARAKWERGEIVLPGELGSWVQ